MFDIGWQELFLVAVAALIVVGPKDLPRALKTVTGAIRKVKGMARDFQGGLDDIVRETELADMRNEIEAQTGGDLRKSIENSIDPDGDLSREMNVMHSFESDLTNTTEDFTKDINKVEEDAKAEDDAKVELPDPIEAMTFTPPEPEKIVEPAPEKAKESTSVNDQDKKDA
jgi:sec-independent protein translocase protein TatB